MMDWFLVSIYVLIELFNAVSAKECILFDENHYISFRCSIYEYCCGSRCCRSPAITFYQMWYFWLMVFLTILFCSGGGWWYRLRNQDSYVRPSFQPRNGQARPVIHPAPGTTVYASTVPIYPTHPANNQYPMPPPPPYYGPPPSYDAVVCPNQPQMQNLIGPNQPQRQNNGPS